MDGCHGRGSGNWSSATSQGFGCCTRIRINASRHDSRQEPYAVVPLVRICAGGGEQSPSLPRPNVASQRERRSAADAYLWPAVSTVL